MIVCENMASCLKSQFASCLVACTDVVKDKLHGECKTGTLSAAYVTSAFLT